MKMSQNTMYKTGEVINIPVCETVEEVLSYIESLPDPVKSINDWIWHTKSLAYYHDLRKRKIAEEERKEQLRRWPAFGVLTKHEKFMLIMTTATPEVIREFLNS